MQSSTSFSCFQKRLLVTNTQKLLMTWFFCHYPSPMHLRSMELDNFAIFCTLLQNSKMSPWWPPNQGECLDRLIARKLKLLQVTKDMELAMGGLVTNGFIIKI